MGLFAGQYHTEGDDNVFLGTSAGQVHQKGNDNVVLGNGAAQHAKDMSSSVIIGKEAGLNTNGGYRDVFIGHQAGMSNTTGWDNVFVGNRAGYLNTEGVCNVLIGSTAGFNVTKGNNNIFIGDNAGPSDYDYGGSCNKNIAIGTNAGFGLGNNSEKNILLGDGCSTYGSTNVVLGHNTKVNGSGNIVLGNDIDFGRTQLNNSLYLGDYIIGSPADESEWSSGKRLDINSSMVLYNDLSVAGNIIGSLVPSSKTSIGGVNLTYNLGSSSNRWSYIYAKYINTTGSISGSKLSITNTTSSSTVKAIEVSSNNGTSWNYGVYSLANSTAGTSVDNVGMYGKAESGAYQNTGVWAVASGACSQAARGIYASATGSTTNYGIFATASGGTTNWAGYFNGNVKITSNLEPGSDQTGTIGTSTNRWKQAYFKNENGGAALIAENANLNSYAASFVGDITVSNKIYGTLNSSSDARLKKNVQTIDGALDKVLKLRGVSYYWKNKEEMGADSTIRHFDNNKHIGVIAQELEEVFPELVSDDKEGFKTVEYTALAPILIEAIKEQQTIIDNQQKQIDELKRLVEELMKK